jgi:hypothetical protein
VQSVVPELQRRGLFRKEYTGATLRDNLGLREASLIPPINRRALRSKIDEPIVDVAAGELVS